MMSNSSGVRSSRRRLLAGVAVSILRYGGPAWASALSVERNLQKLESRCRQISECSDDSIVFCYESDGEDSAHQPDHAYDDEDYSEEEGTDEEDSCDEDSEDTLSHQPDSGFEEKKVQFNLKPVVHVMRTWDFAYRQARKGEWEMAARDRERFKKRIKETEIILCPVFDQNLRDKVYRERFC
ncbi:uncharacterized protein LOC134209566 [Armigeres subalbatus]|uniref:uncharacterized protein LOC134209566 n=1 Tax=Armigeres subalbatus TaxID=124917 RepID=UPI002ED621AD